MKGSKRQHRAGVEAAEWLLRLEDGHSSHEDRDAFVEWLRESPLHVSEMLRVRQLNAALTRFRDWDRISSADSAKEDGSVVPFEHPTNDEPTRPPSVTVPPRPVHGRTRPWLLGAAVAAAAVVTVWVLTLSQVQVIQTGRGERRGVVLADGSLLRIDPESRLRIDLEPHSRNVRLEEGRAAFRVAKDATRPFLVTAGSTVVRAVGTEFGVERAPDGVVVTVASGKVAVFPVDKQPRSDQSGTSTQHPDGDARRLSGEGPSGNDRYAASVGRDRGMRDAADSEVFLTAGQQVTVPPDGAAEAVKLVDKNSALAWADGRLVFENSSVANVVAQFNRYNLIQLHVADSQLANQLVSGTFDESEPDSFIGFIQTVTAVRVTRQGEDVTLSSASSQAR